MKLTLTAQFAILNRLTHFQKMSFREAFYCTFSDYPTIDLLNTMIEELKKENAVRSEIEPVLRERQKMELADLREWI